MSATDDIQAAWKEIEQAAQAQDFRRLQIAGISLSSAMSKAEAEEKMTTINYYYNLGYRHGSTPGHPFQAEKTWKTEAREAYTRGFDDAIDQIAP